jgi:hypothetical protein
MFKGSIVAIVTPFKNNADEKALTELIEWHIKEGTLPLFRAVQQVSQPLWIMKSITGYRNHH